MYNIFMENKTQVIVVGGGIAGISAAITVARAGKEVVLIERGSFCGSKNACALNKSLTTKLAGNLTA